jgi:O-antigen/teichoic acid export membrane protein
MLLVVANAQKKLMQTLIFAATFNIALNLFMIPRYSYLGSATTALFTEALVVFLTGMLVYRHIHFTPSFESVKWILVSGVAMALALFFLDPFSFFLSGCVGMGVYIVMLWLTRAVSPEEIASIFQKDQSLPLSESERIETLVP